MTKVEQEVINGDLIRAEEDILLDFQAALIKAMNDRNLNQVEFAKVLGVSKARISQLLSSDANPTIKLVGRCLALLDRKWSFESHRHEAWRPINVEEAPRSRHQLFAFAVSKQMESAFQWTVETTGPANENYAEQREAA